MERMFNADELTMIKNFVKMLQLSHYSNCIKRYQKLPYTINVKVDQQNYIHTYRCNEEANENLMENEKLLIARYHFSADLQAVEYSLHIMFLPPELQLYFTHNRITSFFTHFTFYTRTATRISLQQETFKLGLIMRRRFYSIFYLAHAF